jgi:phosphohistidine phosphatase
MPRCLLLCRHAETENPAFDQPDIDRNLTAAGITQARMTGAWIKAHYQVAGLVVSSARRTTQTARVLAEMLLLPPEKVIADPLLYNAPTAKIIDRILQLPEDLDTIVVVGHNPGLTQVITDITGTDPGFLEPGNVAVITFPTESWQKIEQTSAILEEVYRPEKS